MRTMSFPTTIQQSISPAGHFGGIVPTGSPTFVTDTWAFAAEAAGGLFEPYDTSVYSFDAQEALILGGVNLVLGGQTAWTVEMIDLAGNTTTLYSGTTELSFSAPRNNEYILLKGSKIKVTTSGGAPSGVFTASVLLIPFSDSRFKDLVTLPLGNFNAPGALYSTKALAAAYTISAGSWQLADNGAGDKLELTVPVAENEQLLLLFNGSTVSPGTTSTVYYRISFDTTPLNGYIRHRPNLTDAVTLTRVTAPLTAGSHTIRVEIYTSATGVAVEADSVLTAVRLRGGLIPVQDDGVAVLSTPEATNFAGPKFAVTDNAGVADVTLTSDVSAVTATPPTLTAAAAETIYTNEGCGAMVVFTLPTAVAGLRYTFVNQDSNQTRVTASSGDTIRVAGSVSAAGGTATSTAVGDVLDLVAINATEWVALTSQGTWTIA